jgi:hypothetical protein
LQDDAQEVELGAWSFDKGIFRGASLLASVYSEIDSQNRQKAEILDTDAECEAKRATALRLQAAMLYHGYSTL